MSFRRRQIESEDSGEFMRSVPYWNRIVVELVRLTASIFRVHNRRLKLIFISFLMQYPTLNMRPKITISTSSSSPSDVPCDEIDNIGLINIPSISQPSHSPDGATESTKKLILLPEEADALPLDCKDLLLRLLEFKPETRIRSIFGLQRIAMFKGFNFDDVRKRKVPALLLEKKSCNFLNGFK